MDIVDFAREAWLSMLIATMFFGSLGFAPKGLLRSVFFLNKSKAMRLDDQLHGFQGFCRFFFWIAALQFVAATVLLMMNAPF